MLQNVSKFCPIQTLTCLNLTLLNMTVAVPPHSRLRDSPSLKLSLIEAPKSYLFSYIVVLLNITGGGIFRPQTCRFVKSPSRKHSFSYEE
jgi:hypothetical protein